MQIAVKVVVGLLIDFLLFKLQNFVDAHVVTYHEAGIITTNAKYSMPWTLSLGLDPPRYYDIGAPSKPQPCLSFHLPADCSTNIPLHSTSTSRGAHGSSRRGF